MRTFFKHLLITSVLVSPAVMAAYSPNEQTNKEELYERLNSLDAEIDREAANNIIDPMRADDLHNQVGVIRYQAETEFYETETLNQEADGVEQALHPLPGNIP